MLYFILPFTVMIFLFLNKWTSWIFKENDPDKGFIKCGKCSTTLLSLLFSVILLITFEFTFVNIINSLTLIFLNPILFVITLKHLNSN